MRRIITLGWLVLALALLPAAAMATQIGPTLKLVRSRGDLVCGVGGSNPGFSLPDGKGVMRGLDADICRAVAAAALGDAAKVHFVPLTTTNRFTALQSGEIDLLSDDTTWTMGRETRLGLLFTAITYYDGTAFMVKKSLGVSTATQLGGASVCVEPGTSTELALADFFRDHGLHFTPVEIQDVQAIRAAFLSGRCDAYATDGSQLAGFRASLTDPAAYVILPELISKEPLGPMVRQGDDQWFNLVRWTIFAMITAEELGVTSDNIDQMRHSPNPSVRRLLGLDGDLGPSLGLAPDWAANIIRQVGNYGQMWHRDLDPLHVTRGLNRLWTKGGLMYAPPLR